MLQVSTVPCISPTQLEWVFRGPNSHQNVVPAAWYTAERAYGETLPRPVLVKEGRVQISVCMSLSKGDDGPSAHMAA